LNSTGACGDAGGVTSVLPVDPPDEGDGTSWVADKDDDVGAVGADSSWWSWGLGI
jgi:hypothetical protein